MSTIEKISGTARTAEGTQACRRLRRQGFTPAVVYGHKQDPERIAIPSDAAEAVARSNARVLDLDVDGNIQKTLIRDVQWDTFSTNVLHIDFLRVDPNERVHTEVPVVLKGTAPGSTAGGVLEVILHALDIECLAVEMPESIVVKVADLQIGQAIHVKEITDLPPGVRILTGEDRIVVQILDPQKVARAIETPPAAEAAPAAAPPAT